MSEPTQRKEWTQEQRDAAFRQIYARCGMAGYGAVAQDLQCELNEARELLKGAVADPSALLPVMVWYTKRNEWIERNTDPTKEG